MISFFKQKIDDQILNKIYSYFNKDNWVNGNITSKFEIKLKKFLRIKHNVISCNSGSDALLISLLLNKKKNKNIYLTTPISYVASASIPKFLNLKLIYIDVEKDNFLMSIDKLEFFLKTCPKNIRKKINGIINVELFGQTSDLIRLNKIAKKYNLSLIGDCAQSLGTKYKNKSTVNYYDYAITSFYPTKILSCYGDGGALFFKEKYEKVFLLKNNGHNLKNKSLCSQIGINSRLDSIQAFILNKEIDKIKNVIIRRKKIFKLYKKLIMSNSKLFKINHENKNLIINNYIYPLFINKFYRLKFLKHMKKNGVECKIFYSKMLPSNKVLKPFIKTNISNARRCTQELICIPSSENLKKKEVIKIIKAINNF